MIRARITINPNPLMTPSNIKLVIYTALIFSCSSMLCGQQAAKQQEAPKPKTELETFAAQTGVVIVKGYSEIGSVSGYAGKASVDCREFTNAANGNKSYGIVITVKESKSYGIDSDNSFIDYDEISSLIDGIAYIRKIDKSVTNLSNFEATYSTKGDLQITVFNQDNGNLKACINSGVIGRTSAFITLDQLDQFRTLLIQAKAKLDELKGGAKQ
jgi:hypothetical protein